ncbi:linalool dehydratase/isomerase domain-containing protein [Nocardia harenae]|uniref:linalool dehydratase/isomerase domain-containing protein n=1 Tax=Nocardia harenae TaxID=358707 RepID=UPI0014725591|nr:hypothetical protein [Nocardia harenae]
MTTTREPEILHTRAGASGSVLRRHRFRALGTWAVTAFVGILPILADAPDGLAAAGLGLWFPGAGFLYGGLWWATVLTLLAFVVAMALWVLMGGFVFPVGVWAGTVLLAGVTAGQEWAPARVVVPATAAVVIAAVGAAMLSRRRTTRRLGERAADELATVAFREPELRNPVPGELDEKDLAELRYLLDRALQPVDEFAGFNTIDQFRESAWRYQLVTMNYALAALQVNHLHAFTGYVQQAQRNAIVKMTDRRVWHYWRIENLVGNFKFGADPIRYENIMYSGWWALALGAYERATGDLQFSEPGALTLVDKPGREYVYDYPAIVEAIVGQFDDRALTFFPCEPNWVFTVCNLYGMGGALLFDRVHGTRHGSDRLDRFNEILESEFTRCDGGAVVIASRRTGLTLSTSEPFSAASNTWLTNIVSPRQAQVAWELARRFNIQRTHGDLHAIVPKGAGLVDPGNYRLTGAWYWASSMVSAREMGDHELYEVAAQKFDALKPMNPDAEHPSEYHRSLFCRAMACVGRFGAQDMWYRFGHGDITEPATAGAHLSEISYREAHVAAAHRDGERLRLVLRPAAGPVGAALRVGGLRPGRRYRAAGTVEPEVTADNRGFATATARVDGRTEVVFGPAE